MNTLIEQFAKMGARAKVRPGNRLTLDVRNDKDGEFFDIQTAEATLSILNVDKPGRHLLLQAREEGGVGEMERGGKTYNTQKFLCGHDERHWFVATVDSKAATVDRAKDSLKPAQVREIERLEKVSRNKRKRRHNKASHRQGEWFFIPQNGWKPPEKAIILKHEPFTRAGGGKAHYAEYAYRSGGESVWVSSRYPNGVDNKTYEKLIKNDPEMKKERWRNMRRGAAMYVKGKISHPDHKTVFLQDWCLVVMNTEQRSSNVAFLD